MIIDRLIEAIGALGNPTAAGMDTRIEHMPESFQKQWDTGTAAGAAQAIAAFNRRVIDALEGIVPCIKIQAACYELYAEAGFGAAGHGRYARSGHTGHRRREAGDIGSPRRVFGGLDQSQRRTTGIRRRLCDRQPYRHRRHRAVSRGLPPIRKGVSYLSRPNPPRRSCRICALPTDAVYRPPTASPCGARGIGAVCSRGRGRGRYHPGQGAALRPDARHVLPAARIRRAGSDRAGIAGMFDRKGGARSSTRPQPADRRGSAEPTTSRRPATGDIDAGRHHGRAGARQFS